MERDFPIALCDDNWSEIGNTEFITNQYRQRYMGLVTDNTESVEFAYTAVFPSAAVLERILADNRRNALLFVHHPMDFDMTRTPVFIDIPKAYLHRLQERKLSIYNLHAPLDANGEYSTTVNFARTLGIEPVEGFYRYHKVDIGIIGTTGCRTVSELKARFEAAVGHEVAWYHHGDDVIDGGRVALVAGGGNDASIYPQLEELGIHTFLTGITNRRDDYPPSIEAHRQAEVCRINLLGGTHYSTEKFACMKMVEYFSNLGIPGEFIAGVPGMMDL
jgi:putative NIF3 family GTP cyclohydrolase 1 type 2